MTDWKAMAEGAQCRLHRIAEIIETVARRGVPESSAGIRRITLQSTITAQEIQEVELLSKSPLVDLGHKRVER